MILTCVIVLISSLPGWIASAQQVGQAECNAIRANARLDCHPERDADQNKCVAKGCCWVPIEPPIPGSPACYFPRNYAAYSVEAVTQTPRGFLANLSKPAPAVSGLEEFAQVLVEVRHETRSRLRVRFTVPSDPNRWEPPIPLGEPRESKSDVSVELVKSPFGLKVVRNTPERQPLIDSSGSLAPSLIMSDQFLQVSFRLFAHVGFGPGELRIPFPHQFDQWLRMGLWTRDHQPMQEANLYGVHNLFMGLTYEGTAFGLFLLNSNAQEVSLTPLPAITYRTLGGILDVFILTGPKPADVIAQYYDLIGHPPVPPYWALGFHLCRYGYRNLDEVIQTVDRNRQAGIPLEVQWFDIDYMDKYKIWSVDPTQFAGLGRFVRQTLHEQYGMRAVLILDPAVSTEAGPNYKPYQSGLELGVFINDSRTGQPIRGHVWPGETVFPDFSHPNAESWWYASAEAFHQQDVPFDGLWIDMNEPADFDSGSIQGCDATSRLDNPPFVPSIVDQSLFARTVCPSAHHHNTTHYNRHNLYGYDQARVTRRVLERLFPGERPFLLSRSTFAGSGRYTTHWTGDNRASWADLKASIAQIIHFNMFAIPMVGADICGFGGQTTEELCIRWSQLGAFYPFTRNHNDLHSPPQDPAVWSPVAVQAIKDVLELRYRLLPYWYSLFFRAHLYGETVVRALAFEFPEDLITHKLDAQFMVGSCLLVTPVLEEGRTQVNGYVPAGEWINLSLGRRVRSRGEQKVFDAPLNVIPILVRAGCVLPLQASPAITSVARKKGLGLLVVLSTVDDGSEAAGRESRAKGELFWDDGKSDPLNYVHVEFTVENRALRLTPNRPRSSFGADYFDPQEVALKYIVISGIDTHPSGVHVNDQVVQFNFNKTVQAVVITCDTCQITEKLTARWSFPNS